MSIGSTSTCEDYYCIFVSLLVQVQWSLYVIHKHCTINFNLSPTFFGTQRSNFTSQQYLQSFAIAMAVIWIGPYEPSLHLHQKVMD
jgi:hypothetical protein